MSNGLHTFVKIGPHLIQLQKGPGSVPRPCRNGGSCQRHSDGAETSSIPAWRHVQPPPVPMIWCAAPGPSRQLSVCFWEGRCLKLEPKMPIDLAPRVTAASLIEPFRGSQEGLAPDILSGARQCRSATLICSLIKLQRLSDILYVFTVHFTVRGQSHVSHSDPSDFRIPQPGPRLH